MGGIMHKPVRPWLISGAALVGASVIAVTPIAPPPDVQLSASIAQIFTFPALQQLILNRIDDIATLGVGLAGSAAGLGLSIALLPATLRTVTQQVLSGDLLGALTTIETALVGSLVAIGQPTLDAIIERWQRYLAVREALQMAVPQVSSVLSAESDKASTECFGHSSPPARIWWLRCCRGIPATSPPAPR